MLHLASNPRAVQSRKHNPVGICQILVCFSKILNEVDPQGSTWEGNLYGGPMTSMFEPILGGWGLQKYMRENIPQNGFGFPWTKTEKVPSTFHFAAHCAFRHPNQTPTTPLQQKSTGTAASPLSVGSGELAEGLLVPCSIVLAQYSVAPLGLYPKMGLPCESDSKKRMSDCLLVIGVQKGHPQMSSALVGDLLPGVLHHWIRAWYWLHPTLPPLLGVP